MRTNKSKWLRARAQEIAVIAAIAVIAVIGDALGVPESPGIETESLENRKHGESVIATIAVVGRKAAERQEALVSDDGDDARCRR
jgi:hypothetical protein